MTQKVCKIESIGFHILGNDTASNSTQSNLNCPYHSLGYHFKLTLKSFVFFHKESRVTLNSTSDEVVIDWAALEEPAQASSLQQEHNAEEDILQFMLNNNGTIRNAKCDTVQLE